MLQGNQEYSLTVDGHENLSNITYRGKARNMEHDDWIVIRHNTPDRIDEASLETVLPPWEANDMREGAVDTDLRPIKVQSWPEAGSTIVPYLYQVQTEKPYFVRYSLSGSRNDPEEPNAIPWTEGVDMYFKPSFYKCLYPDCIAPEPVPPTQPPTMST